MVLVVPVHEILQDGATFPDLELVATLVRVDDGLHIHILVCVFAFSHINIGSRCRAQRLVVHQDMS